MTIDREHLDLIQAELDGELDAAARAELARYLLAHPEARAEREALSRVCEALAAIPAEDPPADLQSRIMSALPPPRGVAPSAGRRRSSGAFFMRREPLHLVAGLAGAALVATLAYQLGSTRVPLPSNHLVGTMGQPTGMKPGSAETAPVSDEALLRVGRFSAVVALRGAPTAPSVSLSVQSGAGLEVIARAGDQEIRFEGLAVVQGSEGAQVADFRPLAQPGIEAVQVDVVEPGSGAVLQRTMLRFERER